MPSIIPDCRLRPGSYLLLLAALLALAPRHAHAQRHTISGTIADAQTGEALIGANIVAVSLDKGTASNTYGFYSLTLPRTDSLTVVFSYIGYQAQVKKIYLTQDVELEVRLTPTNQVLDEISITADRPSLANVVHTRMGVVDVPIQSVERLPAILGEQDVLKVIQLLPGVQSGEEGTAGFHVRGGAADQNLIQLDEATVYNPNHLFGLFSTFNATALNNVTLIKGGFPANYGGRLSSTLEISMREGNRRERVVQGGVGLLSTQMTVEGPIKSEDSSYIISGRRSYFDLLARPFQKGSNTNIYYLYDFNAKVNHRFSSKDRVFFSVFTGRDVAEFVGAGSLGYGMRFGNSTGTLRWNHVFSPKLFANTSLIRNNYMIRVSSIQGDFRSENYSGVEDLTAKTELQYYPNPAHNIQVGGIATLHGFRSTGNAGLGNAGGGQIDPASVPERTSTEAAAYINDRWELSDRFGLNLGIRVPYFSASDTSYAAIEPRVSVRAGLTSTSSIKASYTVMNQFVHRIPSSTASIPSDIWTLSSKRVKPQRAVQYALGYFQNFSDNAFEASAEVYYKDMTNQVHFREGTELLAYQAIENELVFGHGWSYGAELFVRKKRGRLAGWLSYTWSKTEQRFNDLNRGRIFPFKYDRRHNLSVAGTFDLTDRWELGGSFVFRTGSAYTLPAGRLYSAEGSELFKGVYFDYDRLNSYRLGAHHRLDLSATYHLRPKRFSESSLVISVYNAYSHLNPYFVFLTVDTLSGLPETRQVTLLPIIPSLTYNFRF